VQATPGCALLFVLAQVPDAPEGVGYRDTSALGKLYLPEPDSADFAEKAAVDPAIATTRLALYEMRCVAFRKESEGLIQASTAESVLTQVIQDIAAGQIRIVEIDARVEAEFNGLMATCYRHTPPLPIRTLDALPLASARTDNQIELVATDKRMRDAAKLLGLSLFPA
jgi:predicted nucleic acid-binding protein